MSHFIRNGNTYRVASDDSLDIQKKLPVGNYTVKRDDMSGQYFLETVDSFPQPSKLYGDTTKNAGRILNTFMDRESSTGVMLTGEKGSGKTLLAKVISLKARELEVPTIIINQPWTGDTFNKFIQDIDQPTIIMFDEFEKVYHSEEQEAALTLLDGVFPTKKLFIITCNDKWRINEHMRNRPGRIYYMLEFKGLTDAFIREYCEENLHAKEHINKICDIAALFDEFNFDMLKALVEEMNRYGETPQQAMSLLNTKPEYNNGGEFEAELSINGVKVDCDKMWRGNPLTAVVCIDWYPPDDTPPVTSRPQRDDDESVCLAREWQTAEFLPSDIFHVDGNAGKFTYKHDDTILVLVRRKQQSYNYLAF